MRQKGKFWLGFAAVLMSVGLAGCTKGGGEAKSPYREDVSAADLLAAVAEELGEDYWPNMDIPETMLEETYGLSTELYEEAAAQMPMISANVDTLIIVKAKPGKEKEAEDALLAFQKYNREEALQYPSNLGKVQASQVKAFGPYVCFVQLGGDTSFLEQEASEEGDGAVIKHCEQINGKALDVIENMLIKKAD